VRDTGSGMDSATVARIFDPFFTTKPTGHGLGLSAVKGIINNHGGAIQIESELGKGTTFTLVLPRVHHASGDEKRSSSPVPDLGPKRILVADDEPALLSILSRQLNRAGFEVVEAADGQEAVDTFLEHHETIDCVLLDLSMPKLGGEEAQMAMRECRRDIPIIMMSGFSEQEVVNRFRDAGIAGCLQKPVTSETLLSVVREALAG